MRKILMTAIPLIAILTFGFGTVFAAPALTKPEILKIDVCHATGSESNPYVLINVNIHSVEDAQSVGGHGNHGGDSWDSYVYGGVTYDGQGDMDNCNSEPEDTPTPTNEPTATPTDEPTATPTDDPTATPTDDENTPTPTPECQENCQPTATPTEPENTPTPGCQENCTTPTPGITATPESPGGGRSCKEYRALMEAKPGFNPLEPHPQLDRLCPPPSAGSVWPQVLPWLFALLGLGGLGVFGLRKILS